MLKRQLAELEKKLERALQGGLGAGAGQEASSGGRQASGGVPLLRGFQRQPSFLLSWIAISLRSRAKHSQQQDVSGARFCKG